MDIVVHVKTVRRMAFHLPSVLLTGGQGTTFPARMAIVPCGGGTPWAKNDVVP